MTDHDLRTLIAAKDAEIAVLKRKAEAAEAALRSARHALAVTSDIADLRVILAEAVREKGGE